MSFVNSFSDMDDEKMRAIQRPTSLSSSTLTFLRLSAGIMFSMA